MISLKLLGTRIHVAPVPPKIQPAGTIHIPAAYASHQSSVLWRVLGVGKGVEDVLPGNYILLKSPYAHDGSMLKDGTRIIEQHECIAVITEEK